jgi:S-adenosylmethionine:tRNA ribosyltransferase-isomerase
MTVVFDLPAGLEAREPVEPRDRVRLMVSRGTAVSHHCFTELPTLLSAGDLLVVNNSATLPAALDAGGVRVHVSTERADGTWLVELRDFAAARPGLRLEIPEGSLTLLRPYTSRLWVAMASVGAGRVEYLQRFGRPIRYSYTDRDWPLAVYQNAYATEPGSAEMPSAARPFSERVVTRLVAAGVLFAPVLLHTGVASPEAHERPYPERFVVPETTARLVTQAKASGGRVIAVGTTAVRALETAATPDGVVAAASGWTELVVTPEQGVRVVDALLTGFHEPRASHLDLLETVAGRPLLDRMYAEAVEARYLWHEFGDVNLILP